MNEIITQVIATYLRVHKGDMDRHVNSIVINMQRSLISHYANSHELCIDVEYIDDGVSGYTLERPMLRKLLSDVEQGRINTVIVRDLPRLCRDYYTLHALMQMLADHGVRVIVIRDGIDTSVKVNQSSMMKTLWKAYQS